jgi:hypothetical protein
MAGAKVLGGLAADPFISVADYMDAAVSGPARVDDRMSSAPACLFDISQCGLIVHLLPTLSHCGGRVCFFPLELTLFAVISLAPRFHQTDHCPVGFTHDPVRSHAGHRCGRWASRRLPFHGMRMLLGAPADAFGRDQNRNVL